MAISHTKASGTVSVYFANNADALSRLIPCVVMLRTGSSSSPRPRAHEEVPLLLGHLEVAGPRNHRLELCVTTVADAAASPARPAAASAAL